MLVLSRKPDEAFNFPQLGIAVRVLQVQGQRVRIGVDAPAEIQVLRSEILQAELPPGHEFANRLNTASLGLHLAERLMENGRIDEAVRHLESALDRLKQLDREIHLKRGVHHSEQPTDVVETARRVLLVEDDDNERALLTTLLELEGFVVVPAVDGLDALQQLEVCTPDFVLLDMKMPRCDGRQTVERIRVRPAWQELQLIVVSGSTPEAEGLSVGPRGVDAWIPKPVQPQQLVQRLRTQVTTAHRV